MSSEPVQGRTVVMASHGMKVRLACGAAGNVGLHHVQDVLLQIC